MAHGYSFGKTIPKIEDNCSNFHVNRIPLLNPRKKKNGSKLANRITSSNPAKPKKTQMHNQEKNGWKTLSEWVKRGASEGEKGRREMEKEKV